MSQVNRAKSGHNSNSQRVCLVNPFNIRMQPQNGARRIRRCIKLEGRGTLFVTLCHTSPGSAVDLFLLDEIQPYVLVPTHMATLTIRNLDEAAK